MKKILNISMDTDYRIIAISDIHGHHNHLEKLLNKVDLQDDDYLVILGDFVNKGPDSFKTFKMIKDLSKRPRTIVLKGNHEQNMQNVMSKYEKFESVYGVLREANYETLLHAIFKETGELPSTFESSRAHYDSLVERHGDVFEYLGSLPLVLNLGDYRFVHGGYNPEFCLVENERDFLKYDEYNAKSQVNDRMTIVGHWPACFLRDDKISNLPYFNYEKKIISIDGGIGIKSYGEMNALIINKIGDEVSYQTKQVNDFKERTIVSKHKLDKEDRIYVSYPDYEIEVVEVGAFLSKCKHVSSQKTFSIFSELIMNYQGQKVPKIDYVNNFLDLEIGDRVAVCESFEKVSLVKFGDEFGWVLNEQLGS